MSGYTIAIHVGIGTDLHTIHAWIHITKPDGTAEAWGLYPAQDGLGNFISGSGEVRPESTTQEFTASSDPTSISESQYYDFRRYLPTFPSQSPDYSIPFDQQCTQWALGGLMAAGVLPEIPTILLPTPFVNPATLAALFGILKFDDSVIRAFDNFFDWLGHGAVDTIDAIKALFDKAKASLAHEISPLILDLDGDGVETTGTKTGTYFDHGGDGFAEQTGWAGKDDGLLVLDRNKNSLIDNGTELFGDNTLLANGQKAANGFAALADLDSNHDGKIDAQDATFADLRVWKDVNGDGISQAGELLTLTEAGVQSIGTGSTASTLVDANGNAHKQVGSFTRIDGSTATVSDVWLAVDKVHSIAKEWLDVPDDIAVLPDAKGYGQVYDLHQAMVWDQSGALKSLVGQFVAAGSASERNALIDQIIYKWAGADGVNPGSRGGDFDARKLVSLEAFMPIL